MCEYPFYFLVAEDEHCLNIKEQYSLRGDQNDFLIKTHPNDACKMSMG